MTCPAGFHPPVVCRRINSSMDYHTKSYSYRHECPTCGKSRRYNNNFLGNRFELVCDGQKITRHRKGDAVTYTVMVGSAGAVESTVTGTLEQIHEFNDGAHDAAKDE